MSAIGLPVAGRYVGARVQRREDPRLLTGHGVYIDDVRLPGMLHAAFARSPLAHARIASIDAEPARALPGVVAVWTGPELNGDTVGRLWDWSTKDFAFPAVYALAEGDVCFVGDPVAIVVAESRYLAEDAVELIDVEYEELPAVVGREFALSTELRTHRGFETNLAWAKSTPVDPELEQAFAPQRPRHNPHGPSTSPPQRPDGTARDRRRLGAWGGTADGPHLVPEPTHGSRVFRSRARPRRSPGPSDMRDVGGGFGQKIFRGREETAAVLASRRLGQPVKWIEDRQENLTAANHARRRADDDQDRR